MFRGVVGQRSRAHVVFQCPFVSYVRWSKGIEVYLNFGSPSSPLCGTFLGDGTDPLT